MPEGIAPYRTPAPESISWTPPELLEGDVWTPLAGQIEGWDPTIDLTIRGAVHLAPQDLEIATGLEFHEIALGVSWTCSSSRSRGAAPLIELERSGVTQYSVSLAGDRLDGEIEICVALLARPRASVGRGTARRPGSVLASRRFKVALEGTVGMFPVEIVDFVKTSIPNKASWHLETSQELDQAFLAGFRLQINSRDKELTAAIASRAPTAREQALLEDLEEGVLGLLLESASMMQRELASPDTWEPETVGHVLRSMLTKVDDLGAVPTSPADLAMWRAQISSRVRQLGVGRSVS